MVSAKPESPERTGSVRAAISLYGERTHRTTKPDKNRARIPLTEESTMRELQTGKVNDRAEIEKFLAESEAEELALKIEDSNTKSRARRLEIQALSRKPEARDSGGYSDVMRELRNAKQELSRLKLDVNSAIEAKGKAEKAMEASNARAKSYASFVEELRKEIEEENEEHVLVELARIEAEREFREIEAQRRAEAARFSKNTGAAKMKIGELRREIDRAKEIEMNLAATNSDVNVLRNEMELVRAMVRNSQKSSSVIDAELNAAKKELECVKGVGFQYMTSMDLVREEMIDIVKETEQLKKLVKKSDSAVQTLNSKLLKAKSKLESASAADERAEAIVSDLSAALQRLNKEIEATEEEKESIRREIEASEIETEKTESDIKSSEAGLEAAMPELEAAKASEAIAIDKLRHFIEQVMKSRAPASLHSSTITISKFEHDYLRRGAAAAEAVACEKVSAAQAWIEALTAGEKEMVMKCESIKREIQDVVVENEEPESSNSQLASGAARKSIKENAMPAASRRAKMRRAPASPATRYNRHPASFTVKKRMTVIPG